MQRKKKREKGVPVFHNEVKGQVNMSLTPTAVENLDILAKERSVSRSELVEQIARGTIPITDNTSSKNSQNNVANSYPNDAIHDEYLVEFTPGQNTIRLSAWEELPSSPGIFAVYIDEKNTHVYLKNSTNMKQDFMDYVKIKSNIEELIASDGDAYLIWTQCSDRHFRKKIQEDFRHLCNELRNNSAFKFQTLPNRTNTRANLSLQRMFATVEF